jgi:opacity protein-like surface antigen
MPKYMSQIFVAAASLCALAYTPAFAADDDYLQQEALRDWSGFYAGMALGGSIGGADFENIGKKSMTAALLHRPSLATISHPTAGCWELKRI